MICTVSVSQEVKKQGGKALKVCPEEDIKNDEGSLQREKQVENQEGETTDTGQGKVDSCDSESARHGTLRGSPHNDRAPNISGPPRHPDFQFDRLCSAVHARGVGDSGSNHLA